MPDLSALAAAARQALPPGTAVGAADPRRLWPLWPGEDTAGMQPARRAEFSAGRHAARAALAELGLPPCAIPQGGDRAPLWPAGLAGSITHSRTACLAALSPALRGLGLDLEDEAPLDPSLWDIVLRPEERAALTGRADAGHRAMQIFSAKEAAYKAQYAESRTLFGFDHLRIEPGDDGFAAIFCGPAGPFRSGDRISGRWRRLEGQILSLCWV